jgi:RNA polymerase sigma factor (sigma-70 family)
VSERPSPAITTADVPRHTRAPEDAVDWERDYQELFKGAYQAVRRLGASREDAEDAAQTAIITAMQKFDAARGSAAAFVKKIARNDYLSTHRRRERGRRAIEREAQEPRHAEGITAAEARLHGELLSLIESNLSPAEQAVILLAAQGYDDDQIAATRNAAKTTVKSQLSRARRKLKDELVERGYRQYGAGDALPPRATIAMVFKDKLLVYVPED